MTGLDAIALAASLIAAAAAATAMTLRGAVSMDAASGAAILAVSAAAATFGAPAAAAFSVSASAMAAIYVVGGDLVAPETDEKNRTALVGSVSVLLISGVFAFVTSDAPGPAAQARATVSPTSALVAAAIVLAASAAAFALMGEDGRSALDAPAKGDGRFPGREHAVSRGIGKGLAPLLAIAALSLAQPGAAPLAAGTLLALALALYALVFGLDAAVRVAPLPMLSAATWAGFAIAASATAAAALTRFGEIAFGLAGVACALCVAGALGRTFYAVAGRLSALPASDAPDAEGPRRG